MNDAKSDTNWNYCLENDRVSSFQMGLAGIYVSILSNRPTSECERQHIHSCCHITRQVNYRHKKASFFLIKSNSFVRYRAIMYPLRRKPTKCLSKVIIVIIWLFGFAFALPMGLMHSFVYVQDMSSFHQVKQWALSYEWQKWKLYPPLCFHIYRL